MNRINLFSLAGKGVIITSSSRGRGSFVTGQAIVVDGGETI